MNERALDDPALRIAATVADDFEGLSLTPYHDPVGYPTLGYGHLLSRVPWAPLEQWHTPLLRRGSSHPAAKGYGQGSVVRVEADKDSLERQSGGGSCRLRV